MPIWKRSVPSEMHADQRAKRIVELTAMAEKSERDAKCFRTQIDGLLLQVKGADMHAEGLRREIAELVARTSKKNRFYLTMPSRECERYPREAAQRISYDVKNTLPAPD